MVVAASASMTQGQVRLTRLQTQLTAVLGRHHDLEQRVAKLSDPSGVVSQAQRHGLVAPTNVTDLNQVSTSASTSTASTTPAPGKTSVASTGGP
jgi:cell division protein FtsL